MKTELQDKLMGLAPSVATHINWARDGYQPGNVQIATVSVRAIIYGKMCKLTEEVRDIACDPETKPWEENPTIDGRETRVFLRLFQKMEVEAGYYNSIQKALCKELDKAVKLLEKEAV